ncbi:MAG: thioesterase domain-containing protein [Fuerstiella sp.]
MNKEVTMERRVRSLTPGQREFLAAQIAAQQPRVEPPAGRQHLVAWYTTNGSPAPSDRELREHLRQHVSSSVIPQHFVRLDHLPRTATGKIDRQRLTAHALRSPSDTRPAAHRNNATETALLNIWRETLQTPHISVDDNFFEAGGDSLGIIKVIALCSEAGLAVTPGVFHDFPTIRQLAAALDGRQDKPTVPRTAGGAKDNNSVPSTGARPSIAAVSQPTDIDSQVPMCLSPFTNAPPLFLIPPKGVAVSCFRHVVRHITDFTCYAPVTFRRDSADHLTVAELADLFLKQIRRIQPAGPYRLTGTCEGAYAAWTMACRLVADGEEVAFLGIIDTPNPVAMKRKPLSERLRLRLRSIDRSSIIRAAGQFVRRATSWSRRRVQQAVAREAHLTQAGSRMGWLYRPEPFPGNATLFRAIEPPEDSDFTTDVTHGWGDLPQLGLDVCSIACKRLQMLDPPFAKTLAERLQQAIHIRQVFDASTSHHRDLSGVPDEK